MEHLPKYDQGFDLYDVAAFMAEGDLKKRNRFWNRFCMFLGKVQCRPRKRAFYMEYDAIVNQLLPFVDLKAEDYDVNAILLALFDEEKRVAVESEEFSPSSWSSSPSADGEEDQEDGEDTLVRLTLADQAHHATILAGLAAARSSFLQFNAGLIASHLLPKVEVEMANQMRFLEMLTGPEASDRQHTVLSTRNVVPKDTPLEDEVQVGREASKLYLRKYGVRPPKVKRTYPNSVYEMANRYTPDTAVGTLFEAARQYKRKRRQ